METKNNIENNITYQKLIKGFEKLGYDILYIKENFIYSGGNNDTNYFFNFYGKNAIIPNLVKVCLCTKKGLDINGYIIDKNQINYPLITINYPQQKLNLQYESNNYYIISSNYVYLKLDFNINENNVSQENIINAIEQINLQYNQNYVESIYFNVGIGEDYNCLLGNNPNIKLYPKNQTNIFAKILIGSYPGNTDILASNIVNNSNFSINYDFLFDNISGVIISVYDSQLRLLNLFNNFSFTMNIHEIKDVLKETLINTKTNSVNSTGSFM
jgi:hypothetical protein